MMRLIKAGCTVAVIIFAPLALAGDYPKRVSLPNGSVATKEEMVAGQRSVKKSMVDMEDYLTCIAEQDEKIRAGIEDPDLLVEAQRDEMLVKKHNAAVEEMEILAADYNEAVRTYKARKD